MTPDAVHDRFNLLMYTHVTEDGRAHITRQDGKPGDLVDMLALMDVLAIPNVCGADTMRTSNFSLKPLQITVFQAAPDDMARVPAVPTLKSQRTPKDFRNPTIKADRELRKDPAYAPVFTNVPIVETELSIPLTPDELAMLERVKLPVNGDDLGAAPRDVAFSWWEARFLTGASGAPNVESREARAASARDGARARGRANLSCRGPAYRKTRGCRYTPIAHARGGARRPFQARGRS